MWVVGVLAACSAAAVVLILRYHDKGSLWATWAAAVVAAPSLVPLIRRPESPEAVAVADALASAVADQWSRAAADRRLVSPAPVPVRWSLTGLPVAGPVHAAVTSRRFGPVPGTSAVTESALRAGGGRADLHAVYAGLGSGRLVVVGEPGAGKSGAAVLLVLDALAHREGVGAPNRDRVPVPVLFTLHGWDPVAEPFENWLIGRLAGTYPSLFAGRTGRRVAAGLLAGGRVSVVLDGLDEMSPTLQPVALRALSDQARVRVVLLTRTTELVAAAGYLVDAAALELHPIDHLSAATYLERALDGPAPARWDSLLDHLRDNLDGPVVAALSTPLMLSLVRDTYRAGDDLTALLALATADRADVEGHLLDRVLPAAYAPRPGQPAPRYPLARAELALRYLATQLSRRGTRDLVWWLIPTWAPRWPRTLATTAVACFLFGFATGLGSV